MPTKTPVPVPRDWKLIYDSTVDGDYNGLIQAQGAGGAYFVISDTIPAPGALGVLVQSPELVPVVLKSASTDRLYARAVLSDASIILGVPGVASDGQQVATEIGSKTDPRATNTSDPWSLNSLLRGALYYFINGIGEGSQSAATNDTGTFSLLQLTKRLLTKFSNDASGRLLTLGRLDYRTSQMEASLQGKAWFVQGKVTATSTQYGSVQIWNPANSGKTLQISSLLAAVETAGKVYPFLENADKGTVPGSGVIALNNKGGVTDSPSFEIRTQSAAAATTPLLTEGIQVTSTLPSGQGLLISGQSIVLPPGYGYRLEYAVTTQKYMIITATITEIDNAQVT